MPPSGHTEEQNNYLAPVLPDTPPLHQQDSDFYHGVLSSLCKVNFISFSPPSRLPEGSVVVIKRTALRCAAVKPESLLSAERSAVAAVVFGGLFRGTDGNKQV